ncbi:MAG: dihydroorotase [Gammaproteobacteria bacterium]|nr:dihydroorotase [Gammaproteobacteria bacterium]
MAEDSLLITNARFVNEGHITEGNLRVRNGRIDAMAPSLAAATGETVLDAAGRYLVPGFIDDQVHFREPGLTQKGDMATESAAAVAGGITSFMEMPNVKPPTTHRAAVADKYERAAGRARANFAFYLGATNDNLDELRAVTPAEACGIKVFMGASTGNMLVDNPQVLEQLFADAPLLIAAHCEHTPTILANEATARERYGEDVPMSEHPLIRSEQACFKSSAMAVDLARRHDARLHVLHLTTAREMELFRSGPLAAKRITAEVCVHHLYFSADDYERLGARIKCNPAVKTAADRQSLLAALRDDRIDVVATDHAPHLAEEKARSYFQAPAGLPLVQHALLSLLEYHHDGVLPLELIVRKASHAPAELFGITDRGFLREGYWADLVLLDLDRPTLATDATALYKCGWTPFDGVNFRSTIAATLVNGQLAWQDGQLTGAIAGQRLDCNAAR